MNVQVFQKTIVPDINIANALYTMLNAMGHLLNDIGWDHITNGALVQDYSIDHPTQGRYFMK